jgi:hypothetical protein
MPRKSSSKKPIRRSSNPVRGKKSKSSLRRTRSAPVKSRKKSKTSSKSKKRKSLAESVYGRFQSPEEIGMNYLKTIYDKYGEVNIGEVDKKKIKSLQKKEEQRQKTLLSQMKQRDSALKQMELIGFEDIPHVQGKPNMYGEERPDLMMNQLNCKDRVQWCSTNKEQRDYCKRQEVHDKYILPCKLDVKINKKINKEILDTNLTDLDDYKEDLRRINHLYEEVQELDIRSYLARYLSFGPDYGNKKVKMIIRCDFDRNPILGGLRFPSGDYQSWSSRVISKLGIGRSRELAMQSYLLNRSVVGGNIWTEDLFLELCRCISPEEMHSLIDQWYNADKEDRELSYTSIKQTMSFYQEDSVAWWISALICNFFYQIDTSETRYPSDPMFDFLMEDEDLTLDVFSGETIQSSMSWFRRDIKSFVPGKLDSIIAWLRNPRVKDENLENFMEFKNIFVFRSRISVGIEESRSYQAFDEFTDLLCFNDGTGYIRDPIPTTSNINDYLREEKDKYMEQFLIDD